MPAWRGSSASGTPYSRWKPPGPRPGSGFTVLAVTCGLGPVKDFACSVAEHWDGVIRWFQSRISNGVLEAISRLIQAAKRRARGYRTTDNLMAIVYLTVGKLDFGLPT